MHFGIQGPRRGGIPQRRDCVGMASLPSERHSQIEGRVGLIRLSVEHGAKCPLGLSELFLLEVLPARGEARVDRRRARRFRTVTGFALKRSHRE
jgi:hypothetical protein